MYPYTRGCFSGPFIEQNNFSKPRMVGYSLTPHPSTFPQSHTWVHAQRYTDICTHAHKCHFRNPHPNEDLQSTENILFYSEPLLCRWKSQVLGRRSMLGSFPSLSLLTPSDWKGPEPRGRAHEAMTEVSSLTGHFLTILRVRTGAEITSEELSFSMILLEKRTKCL